MAIRLALLLLVLLPIIGCGMGGGGNVIEPESKGGSPILNKTAPQTPAPKTGG